MNTKLACSGLPFALAALFALTSCEQKTETVAPPPADKKTETNTTVNPSTQMAAEHGPDVGESPTSDAGKPPPL